MISFITIFRRIIPERAYHIIERERIILFSNIFLPDFLKKNVISVIKLPQEITWTSYEWRFIKQLISFPISVLSWASMYARFSISRENSAVRFKRQANGSVSAICRAVPGEACNGGVQFRILGCSLEVRQTFICIYPFHMSGISQDIVPLVRQIADILNYLMVYPRNRGYL